MQKYFATKYLSLYFFLLGLAALGYAVSVGGADGWFWIAAVPLALGLIIGGINYRNTGTIFTDSSGGK